MAPASPRDISGARVIKVSELITRLCERLSPLAASLGSKNLDLCFSSVALEHRVRVDLKELEAVMAELVLRGARRSPKDRVIEIIPCIVGNFFFLTVQSELKPAEAHSRVAANEPMHFMAGKHGGRFFAQEVHDTDVDSSGRLVADILLPLYRGD